MTTATTSNKEFAVTKLDIWQIFARYGAIALLIVLIIAFSLTLPAFATWSNAINVLDQIALPAIVAMGLTVVLAAGEFDLSIGYQTSLAGVLCVGLMQKQGLGIPLAFLITVAAIATIGLLNGVLVAHFKINSLVATLGVGTIVVGLNFAYTKGIPINLSDPTAFVGLSLGRFLGLPIPIYLMVGVGVALWIVLNRTPVGHAIQAVGGNAEAARLSGIRVKGIRLFVFVIASVSCAIAGFYLASRTGGGSTNAGDGFLLSAFAAAFFGSAVLRDGKFHIVGTLIGVLTVGVAFNAMSIAGSDTSLQYLFQGVLLIVGVGVGVLARRRSVTR
ncbi:ribose ABC transporter permease [Arthrobacter sp. StoSoilA2]|uniref:ABC transporter permease n=1 Tax=Arthrobacter sp. StoSoilA2 TaxID=2830990 RepID=UPI001CC371EF|nr:ABC transporter permease [Arthrobacter sp. StoSoilA2]BCW35865.1 ribose ABC transporter permease [Arthrobacter sp. StoSoilA2]